MATEKQIKNYVAKRRKVYEASHDHYQGLRRENPSRSAIYQNRAKEADSAALALEYVEYFIEHGEEHPDLSNPVTVAGDTPPSTNSAVSGGTTE